MEFLLRRLKSKTYWAALIGAVLTVVETNSGFFGQIVPVEFRPYAVMFWPVVMLVLREFTTVALSEK